MSNPPVNIVRTVPVIYYRYLIKLGRSQSVVINQPLPRPTTRQRELDLSIKLVNHYIQNILPEFYEAAFLGDIAERIKLTKPFKTRAESYTVSQSFGAIETPTVEELGGDETKRNPLHYTQVACRELTYATDQRARMDVLKCLNIVNRSLKIIMKERFWEIAKEALELVSGQEHDFDMEELAREPLTRALQAAVPESMYNRFATRAIHKDVTLSTFIRECLLEWESKQE